MKLKWCGGPVYNCLVAAHVVDVNLYLIFGHKSPGYGEYRKARAVCNHLFVSSGFNSRCLEEGQRKPGSK